MKISVKVITNAKTKEIVTDEILPNGQRFLKIKVNQTPQNGKANNEVIATLAKHFNIKKSQIAITSGQTTNNKIVEINDL